MFDKSQTCKLVVIFNCKLKSLPHNTYYVTSLGSTNSFRASSLGLLSSYSSEAKKCEYCANENMITGNLLMNVVFILLPAILEELKILAE